MPIASDMEKARLLGNNLSDRNRINFKRRGYDSFQHQKRMVNSQYTAEYDAKRIAYNRQREKFCQDLTNIVGDIFVQHRENLNYEEYDKDEFKYEDGQRVEVSKRPRRFTAVDRSHIYQMQAPVDTFVRVDGSYHVYSKIDNLLKEFAERNYALRKVKNELKLIQAKEEKKNISTDEIKKFKEERQQLQNKQKTLRNNLKGTQGKINNLHIDPELKKLDSFITKVQNFTNDGSKVTAEGINALKTEVNEMYNTRYFSFGSLVSGINRIENRIHTEERAKSGSGFRISRKWRNATKHIESNLEKLKKMAEKKTLTKEGVDSCFEEIKKNIHDIQNIQYRSVDDFMALKYRFGWSYRNQTAGYHHGVPGHRNTLFNSYTNMSKLAGSQRR